MKRGPIFLNSFDVRTRNLTKKTPRQRFRSNLNFTRIYEKEGGINICVQLRKELERFHHPSKGHNKVSSSPSSFSSSGNVTGDKLLSSAPARGETRWSVGYHVNTITWKLGTTNAPSEHRLLLLLSYFTTLREEGNAVDFFSSSPSPLLLRNHEYHRIPLFPFTFHFIDLHFAYFSLFRFLSKESRHPMYVSQSHYPPTSPLLLFCQSLASFAISRARPTNYHHRGLPRDDAVLNGQYQ